MKKLSFIMLVLLGLFAKAFCEEILPESFKDYQQIEIPNDVGGKGVVYIPNHVKYQKEIKVNDESKYELLKFRISNMQFEIIFGSGPSEGPLFSISALKDAKTFKKSIEAEKIYISDSGSIFAESRFGQFYNLKRKYAMTEKGIEEQRQPYYSIDIQCKVNEDLELKSERCSNGEMIAIIPKGMTVRVLLAEHYDAYFNEPCTKGKNFLVKTSFGLVGWACTSPGHMVYGRPPQLDCLRYDSP